MTPPEYIDHLKRIDILTLSSEQIKIVRHSTRIVLEAYLIHHPPDPEIDRQTKQINDGILEIDPTYVPHKTVVPTHADINFLIHFLVLLNLVKQNKLL